MDPDKDPREKKMRLTLSQREWRKLAHRGIEEGLSVPALIIQIVRGRISPMGEADD